MGIFRQTPLVHRAPPWPEQREALVELIVADTRQDLDTLECLAEAARDRAGLPSDTIRAEVRARALGYELCPSRFNAYVAGVIHFHELWRGCRREWAICHETGHADLERCGLPHWHADVQAWAVFYAVPRADVVLALRQFTRRRAVAWLCRKYRRLPAWVVRLRVALFFAMAQAA